MQDENVEMAIRRALGLIQVKKKHALKRVSKRKHPIKPFGVRLGIEWWSSRNVKRIKNHLHY